MTTSGKHILKQLERFVNRLFCFSLEKFNFSKVKVSAPFFYLYSQNTTNLAHKEITENPTIGFFKSTYVNTKKNCIHVLCKNDFEYLTLAGVKRHFN